MFISVIRQGVLSVNTKTCARNPCTLQFMRSFRSNSRNVDSRISQKRVSLREKLFQPATETPFTIGKGALIGGSAFGIGSLCYYGLGMSSEAGIIEKSYLWSQRVRDRISTTYMYFGGSILMTAAGAAATLRSPVLLNIVAKPGIMGLVVSMAAVIGTSMVTRGIEYREGFGPKQISWLIHSAVMGTFIAPICLMGGPIVARAAIYTAGIFGGLSTIAVCAPSEKFLMMGGPLAMGMGFVFVSSLASCFIAPTTAIGAGLYSISMYGGLLLFSGFLLYDTQRVVKHAEYEMMHYDPVNQSMSIYMDTLNIFIRLVMIMSGMNGNRRK